MTVATLKFLALAALCLTAPKPGAWGQATNKGQLPAPGQQSLPGAKGAGTPASPAQQGGDSKPASGSQANGERQSASGTQTGPGPLDPASPPARVFARPRIGLALGGGGALGLSEIGTLQWMEEHHIPVDVIAGTSMGCMVSALYSTGRTPEQLKSVMNDKVFVSVFSFSNAYTSRSFRRREDSRDLPNAITIGLKHGISFRNAVLTDQGLNAFLDRQFLRYDDQTDFNALPIPLRCLSTDLNDAQIVTFARGSLPDAVRASVSLPGIYQPFEMKGHEYVDGGVLENLPTRTVHAMDADVVIAISLPLEPVSKGQLGSLLGLLGRSFSVAIEGAEREQRKLADVVIMPDLKGFTTTDYLKTDDLAQRGYAAAEAQRAALLRYALSDADWNAYLTHRNNLRRGPAGPVLRVRVSAPNESATRAVQRLFAPLVNQPVDTRRIEALLDQVRADGRYDADYTVGYESAQKYAAETSGKAPLPPGTIQADVATQPQTPAGKQKETAARKDGGANPKAGTVSTGEQPGTGTQSAQDDARLATLADHPGAPGLSATKDATPETLADVADRPILLVTVADKKSGPPFLLLGANLQAQTTAVTRATLEATLLNQDLGGYGAELRTHLKLGYLTNISTEYFRPVGPFYSNERTFFLAPHAELLRQPFSIYRSQVRLSDRQLQRFSAGADVGFTNQRNSELRVGYDVSHIRWDRTIGSDGLPDYFGNAQRGRVRFSFDTQDRALVPQFGVHLVSEAAYLFDAVGSENSPQLSTQMSYAHRFSLRRLLQAQPSADGGHEVLILGAEGGSMLHRNVAEPFRYTLGGPLRLSASAIDEYRGTDYVLFEPALLRRIAQLPQPLGQSIYLGGALEFGYIWAPGRQDIHREDAFLGVVAETPLGVITAGPSIGSNGERKFVFTLGKLF